MGTPIEDPEEIVVRAFRAGKLYIVNEEQRQEIVVNAKVGHIVHLNNIFKYSFDFESAKVLEPEGYRPLLVNDRRHNRKYYGFAYHFREQSLEELCPVHTSCIPSIEITKGRPQLYTVDNVIKNGVNTSYVNVSFCVCPDAYGFLKLYFVDKFKARRLRAAVTVELSPPVDEFYNPDYRTLFEAISRSKHVIYETFHYIYKNGDLFKVFIADKYRLYKYIVKGEIVTGTSFFIVYASIQFILTAISKRIIYVIFHFHRLLKIKLAKSNSKCWNRVYDVYLLYSDSSDNDMAIVRETLMAAFDQGQLKYFDCSDDNLEGGNRTRQYREKMKLSKSVLILLSQDLMDDERCLSEQVDQVLCSLIQEGIVSVSDVIVLTVGHLEQLLTPTLKLFGRIKWNNITEESRLTELKDKLMTVIMPRSSIFMKLDRILRVIEVYCFTEI
ncbi:uncharacterized protein LOC128212955 [Mya arenaria]|uniref:uncharacterized protein LOC128212955 n=1 Tax=Mya arenaria TaxID=6604 RepID=UPI0022DFF2F6|nr:uncharacterized protein LOC128212955 [Mya arenaria]XP_052774327.1 uncharacterized protein LOC128212955 [Mya arenaria]XP_052774328.1 uncharacterized protein LOC128212955 [Mya arenaria]